MNARDRYLRLKLYRQRQERLRFGHSRETLLELRRRNLQYLGYVNRNGCHNCDHVFCLSCYDEGDGYFCTFESPQRPPSNSVLMGEADFSGPWFSSHLETMDRYSAWDNWAIPREVSGWGICPHWKSKSNSK